MEPISVRVSVTPGARKEKVTVLKEHTLEIVVKDEAERGEATARVRELVSLHYRVPLSQVRLRTGARSRHKVFSVTMNT